jgi:threonine dehydratase
MGAFKFRGAYNALSQLSDEKKKAGVLTYSSGNHAQAVALSGKILGIDATIIMPEDAPKLKMQATKDYGGNVIIYDRYTEDREAIAAKISEEKGSTIIPPYNHVDVIAG